MHVEILHVYRLPLTVLHTQLLIFHPSYAMAVDVWTLAFSADSCQLATGSHDGKINLFNVKEGKKQSALDTRGKFIMSIAYVSCRKDYCTHMIVASSKVMERRLIIICEWTFLSTV